MKKAQSEKEDLMGLAFLVGGHINQLKQTSLGSSKNVSAGLEDPRQFVQKVAQQDLTKSVTEARLELLKKQQSASLSKDNPTKNVENANKNEKSLSVSNIDLESKQCCLETNRLLSNIEKSIKNIEIILQKYSGS